MATVVPSADHSLPCAALHLSGISSVLTLPAGRDSSPVERAGIVTRAAPAPYQKTAGAAAKLGAIMDGES